MPIAFVLFVLQVLLAPPLYRHHPNWYQRNLTQVAASFSATFSADVQPNFHLLPAFTSQDLMPDGVFLTPVSGLHYVLHLFDQAESVLSGLALSGDAQLLQVRETVHHHADRFVYLENRHNRLQEVSSLKAAVDAEFNDWILNRSEEDWFTISGLPRLTQIAPSEWQDAVRQQVSDMIKIILNANRARMDYAVLLVINPFRHQTTGPTTYNVRISSVAASQRVRDLFSGFFCHNRPVKLPNELKGLQLRNKVTKDTKIRIQILRELGEVYMAANRGSSFKVRGFEPRPLLITYPPQNSNSRQRTYNFIQAATTLGSRFSDKNLIQIYKVVRNSNPGRLRTLFIVLNDDDRERCQALAKTATRFRSRRGDRPQSGSGSVRSSGGGSGGTPGVSFAPVQTSSGFVFGSGAGMDAEAVGLEAGFLNSLRSEPPPPPPSPSRSQRSDSRDSRGSSTRPSKDEKSQPSKSSMKRGRHSSESSVETKKSSKRSKSKSKSKRRHRSPSTSSRSSSGSGSGSSSSNHSKGRAHEKDKNRDRNRQRSSGSSRSPSPSRKRDKGSNRNKEKSKDKNRERSEHRTKDKTKDKPRDKAKETREEKTK